MTYRLQFVAPDEPETNVFAWSVWRPRPGLQILASLTDLKLNLQLILPLILFDLLNQLRITLNLRSINNIIFKNYFHPFKFQSHTSNFLQVSKIK